MARRLIKFPLKMKNGAEVRSLEELRENADVESIMKYYFSGQLGLWCRAFGYTDFSEQLEDVNIGIIKSIYEKLDIPYKSDEAIEYLHDNHGFSVENIVGVADNTEETVVDNQDIKKKLAEYVDNDINLDDYSIEVTPVNDDNGKVIKYRVAIENEKTEQYSRFVLPYDVKSNYTQKNFEDDLYKKIAYVLKKKVEENDYLKLKNRYAWLKVGDTFEFGTFNGKPIKWLVLTNKDGKLFVISDRILCKRAYGAKTWEKSDIRHWLNIKFYNTAFNESEKKHIESCERTNSYGVKFLCNDIHIYKTQDKVFLLSGFEVENYLSGDLVDKKQIDGDWLLSTSIPSQGGVLCVQSSSAHLSRGNGVISIKSFSDKICGVRPAFWLKY